MTFLESTCQGVWEAFGLSTAVALTFVGIVIALSATNVMPSYASRKLLHIGIGPLYVFCWRLYPLYLSNGDQNSLLCSPRFVASLLPGAISVVFALIGFRLLPKDFGLVKVMSRSGRDPSEIVRGPLIYGIMHVVLTLLFWVDSPAGVAALAMLCGGDGFAEVVGRRWGHITGPIPWSINRSKTIAGTVGFIVTGFIFANVMLLSTMMARADQALGPFGYTGSFMDELKLLFLCFATSMVETIPVHEIDNALVPIATIILSKMLW